MVLFYGLLSLVLIGPLLPPQPSRDAALKGAYLAGALSIMMTLQALLTVNIRAGLQHLLLPAAWILAGSFALSLLAAVFLALLTAWASSGRFAGRRYIRLGFLLILAALVSFVRFAPPGIRSYVGEQINDGGLARIAAFLCSGLLALDAALWVLVGKGFRPEPSMR